MATAKSIRELKGTLAKNQLVVLDRSPKIKEKLEGYVVAANEHFVMLHLLGNGIYLDGYSIVRDQDIRRYRVLRDWERFAHKALKIRKQFPVQQSKIAIDSFATIFETIMKRFPLVTVYRERMNDSACYIGKVKKLTEATVTLSEIDPGAKWGRVRRYNFKDITRIDFGQPYECALWLVACHESGDKAALRRAKKLDQPYAKRGH
ncbi:MAG: hypothetical protein WAU88_03815 [Candidatus Zixiibacteriota bacterium]